MAWLEYTAPPSQRKECHTKKQKNTQTPSTTHRNFRRAQAERAPFTPKAGRERRRQPASAPAASASAIPSPSHWARGVKPTANASSAGSHWSSTLPHTLPTSSRTPGPSPGSARRARHRPLA